MSEEKLVIIKKKSFQELIKLLKTKTGLNLEYYRRTFILRRIQARMVRININDLDSYNSYLLSDKYEIREFVRTFNINYTYFFRDWSVYATIQNLFLKTLNIEDEGFIRVLRPRLPVDGQKNPKRKKMAEQIIKYNESLFSNLKELSLYKKIKNPKKVKVPIYIWSCACASGEEPYSLAMILNNLKENIKIFPEYEVIASDIDKFAIEDAKRGIYREESIKDVSEYYENKYFSKRNAPSGTEYHLSRKIIKNITLINEDITKVHLYSWKFDIILCRNLLIYFNIENRNRFINTIERQLNEGGLLVLGKTESLFEKQGALKLVDPTNHIYIKDSKNKVSI